MLYFSSGLFLRLAGWLHCNLITSESTEGKYQAIYGERLWSSRLFIKWALVALGVAVVTSPLIPTPWGRETQVEKSTFWSMPAGGWQNPYIKTGQDGGMLSSSWNSRVLPGGTEIHKHRAASFSFQEGVAPTPHWASCWGKCRSGGELTWFISQFCLFQGGNVTPLCLSLLTCKVGVRTVSPFHRLLWGSETLRHMKYLEQILRISAQVEKELCKKLIHEAQLI